MMSASTSIAPTKAAVSTATNPDSENASVLMLPPQSSITNATPTDAPLLIPKMDGPASGFRKAVWSISPLTASDAPQNIAVTACGNLLSRTM